MHPAGLVELTHGGIDDRHAGLPLLPEVEPVLVVLPGEAAPLLAVGAIGEFREMKQSLLVKLAPAQLLLPHCNGLQVLLAAGLLTGVLGGTPGLARAEGADAQGSTEVGGACGTGEIAVRLIAEQRPITEAVELGQRRRFSRAAGADLSALETMALPQSLQGLTGRQLSRIKIHQPGGGRNGAGLLGQHLAAPVAQERAIHAVWVTTTGLEQLRSDQQLIPIHHHLAAIGLQFFGHLAVPLTGIGLHIAVPHHSFGTDLLRQLRQHRHRVSFDDQQPATGLPPALLQFHQALDQKPQPGRRHRRQMIRRVDQLRVEHVHPRHRRTDVRSSHQTKVVRQAQVAAVPEQNARAGHQRPRSCLARNQAVTLLPSSHSSPEANAASS